jgi:hypothetical protein
MTSPLTVSVPCVTLLYGLMQAAPSQVKAHPCLLFGVLFGNVGCNSFKMNLRLCFIWKIQILGTSSGVTTTFSISADFSLLCWKFFHFSGALLLHISRWNYRAHLLSPILLAPPPPPKYSGCSRKSLSQHCPLLVVKVFPLFFIYLFLTIVCT